MIVLSQIKSALWKILYFQSRVPRTVRPCSSPRSSSARQAAYFLPWWV